MREFNYDDVLIAEQGPLPREGDDSIEDWVNAGGDLMRLPALSELYRQESRHFAYSRAEIPLTEAELLNLSHDPSETPWTSD